jgi:Rrf2 family transcriptional regulator, iron-sulfur cluster assembly transcription factor
MKLSTRSRYGARLLLDLAKHGQDGPVGVAEIAKRQDISLKYLEKLAKVLKKGGIIRSVRGARGGYLLTRPPGEITMGQVVRVLEGDLSLVACTNDHSVCPRREVCPTVGMWRDVSQVLLQKLDSITMESLLSSYPEGSGPGPCPGSL